MHKLWMLVDISQLLLHVLKILPTTKPLCHYIYIRHLHITALTIGKQLHLKALYRPWGKIKRGQWVLDYLAGCLTPSRGWQYVFTAVDGVLVLFFAKPTKYTNQHNTTEALVQLHQQ